MGDTISMSIARVNQLEKRNQSAAKIRGKANLSKSNIAAN